MCKVINLRKYMLDKKVEEVARLFKIQNGRPMTFEEKASIRRLIAEESNN